MPRVVTPPRWQLFFTRESLGVVVAILMVVGLVILSYHALLISGAWSGL